MGGITINTETTSIVILTFNQLDYTKLCIESIRQYTAEGSYELIVVDNHSTDGTVDWLSEQTDIRTIFNSQNLGFPKGCNQGMAIATGDTILLLNNDIIATHNWLTNLMSCLYSSSDIGAVGPVTNNCSNYQVVPASYQSANELHNFACRHNTSLPELWEERLKLVGFCLLIKREVINQIGFLDEVFTPGNFEDDDYSVRIRRAGYRLMLCRDTYIHHFGSTSFREKQEEYVQLLEQNCRKFEAKWGYNPHHTLAIRHDIIDLIDDSPDAGMRVLEVGCACGGTLLQIKNRYKKAQLYGIESNLNAAEDAKNFAQILVADIEQTKLDYPQDFFDYIILADVLGQLRNPWTILNQLYQYLAPGGKILASIPNVMHFTIIRNLLHGRWMYENSGILARTNLRFFTLSEINQLFSGAGYTISDGKSSILTGSEEDAKFVDNLVNLTGNPALRNQFQIFQYLVKAVKSGEQNRQIPDISEINNTEKSTKSEVMRNLTFLLRRIEQDIQRSENIANLVCQLNDGTIAVEDILEAVSRSIIKKAEVLYFISRDCFEEKMLSHSSDLLKHAYQLTAYNPYTACSFTQNILNLMQEILETTHE